MKNLLSSTNQPTTMDSPLSRYSTSRTVHFSPTTISTPTKPKQQQQQQRNKNQNLSENHLQWIQDLVDTPAIDQTRTPSTIKPIATTTTTPTAKTAATPPSPPTTTPTTTTTPVKTSTYFTHNTPLSSSIQKQQALQSTTPGKIAAPSNRVPISLDPHLAHNGLILGRKFILDRIRVNLLSFIILWILTSTRIYNECILSLVTRMPFLSVPLQVTEWLLLVLLCGNLVEGYYRLKTQIPVTHVDLPLTPQQRRGGAIQVFHKHPLSTSLGHHEDPLRRSIHSPLLNRSSFLSSSLRSSPSSSTPNHRHTDYHHHHQQTHKDEVLSRDPTINPLSRSTLFKRSVFSPSSTVLPSSSLPTTTSSSSSSSNLFKESYRPTSSGFRNVSNQLSLQKLLDENLFPATTTTTNPHPP